MKNKALFEQYPLQPEQTLSNGTVVQTPYHIYDGHMLLIGGTADLKSAQDALKNETVSPVVTADSRALMAIWICDFTDANLGPHTELQLSFLVSAQPLEPVDTHPFTLLDLLVFNPDVEMFCYNLWNNTDVVVRYNTELLGLCAQLTQSSIQRGNGVKHFDFKDMQGNLILSGKVQEKKRQPIGAALSLIKLMGFKKLGEMNNQPWITAQVINPINEHLPRNGIAETYTASESQVLQFYDGSKDQLQFADKRFDFQPIFVEHLDGVNFIYRLC